MPPIEAFPAVRSACRRRTARCQGQRRGPATRPACRFLQRPNRRSCVSGTGNWRRRRLILRNCDASQIRAIHMHEVDEARSIIHHGNVIRQFSCLLLPRSQRPSFLQRRGRGSVWIRAPLQTRPNVTLQRGRTLAISISVSYPTSIVFDPTQSESAASRQKHAPVIIPRVAIPCGAISSSALEPYPFTNPRVASTRLAPASGSLFSVMSVTQRAIGARLQHRKPRSMVSPRCRPEQQATRRRQSVTFSSPCGSQGICLSKSGTPAPAPRNPAWRRAPRPVPPRHGWRRPVEDRRAGSREIAAARSSCPRWTKSQPSSSARRQ